MKKERVQKFIALSGLCSRRKAEDLIKEGKVKVNEKIIFLGEQCLSTDEIKVNDKLIKFDIEDKTYIILNKKKGYVTTKSDEFGRKTVFDLLKSEDKKENLFSVGRLDKDTTGLLILTNDGNFTQKIIHPSSKIKKEYLVILDKKLCNEDKIEIEKGVVLDGRKLANCKIKRFSQQKYLVWILEGRKRQIRRMFEMKEYRIIGLHRTKIGNIDLKNFNLKEGEYKKITYDELEKRIFKIKS